ncbi:MAG: hypothetical protein ACRDX8_07520 [Acidimicrobiales bacterium]
MLRKGAPPSTALAVRRPGDGVTAFGLGPDQAARIVRWSERATSRKLANRSVRGAGGGASGYLAALLRSVDLLTGEIVTGDHSDAPESAVS